MMRVLMRSLLRGLSKSLSECVHDWVLILDRQTVGSRRRGQVRRLHPAAARARVYQGARRDPLSAAKPASLRSRVEWAP